MSAPDPTTAPVRRPRLAGLVAGLGDRLARARRDARAADVVLPIPGSRRGGAPARAWSWLAGLDHMARVTGGMIALSLLCIWIVFGLIVQASYREHWDDASAYADNVAKLLAADLETNFTICDLSLQALVSNLANPALMSLPNPLRHRTMFTGALELPILGSLIATDREGIVREESLPPHKAPFAVADRDYFKVQRDHSGAGIFVNHPFISRMTGDWMVVVSRRIEKDGVFDGVVAGGLRLDYLKTLFLKVHLPADSSLVLRYEDGTVMMSNAPGATGWKPAFVKHAAEASEAIVVSRSSDGIPRLVRERKLVGLPLYQSVSLPVKGIMADFWRRTLVTAVGFLVLSGIISALGVTLMRELSRRTAAEALLQRLATIDGLTGLRNRRCFDEMLEAEVRRGARGGQPLALLMIDVDHFKAYNDTYGHSAGDAALRAVAEILSGEPLRSSDIVARVGGEEFAVLAPDTDLAGAARLAERVRCAVRERRVPHIGSRLGIVTVSIGLACLRDEAATERAPGDAAAGTGWAKALFDEADVALYRAKRGGRDRAEVSQCRVGRETDDRLIA